MRELDTHFYYEKAPNFLASRFKEKPPPNRLHTLLIRVLATSFVESGSQTHVVRQVAYSVVKQRVFHVVWTHFQS